MDEFMYLGNDDLKRLEKYVKDNFDLYNFEIRKANNSIYLFTEQDNTYLFFFKRISRNLWCSCNVWFTRL